VQLHRVWIEELSAGAEKCCTGLKYSVAASSTFIATLP